MEMNESPLKTLYGILKDNNFELPEYDSFERTLNDDKQARHELYKLMRDNHVEVPDQYDRFERTLFPNDFYNEEDPSNVSNAPSERTKATMTDSELKKREEFTKQQVNQLRTGGQTVPMQPRDHIYYKSRPEVQLPFTNPTQTTATKPSNYQTGSSQPTYTPGTSTQQKTQAPAPKPKPKPKPQPKTMSPKLQPRQNNLATDLLTAKMEETPMAKEMQRQQNTRVPFASEEATRDHDRQQFLENTGEQLEQLQQSQEGLSQRLDETRENTQKAVSLNGSHERQYNPETGKVEDVYYTMAGNKVNNPIEQADENLRVSNPKEWQRRQIEPELNEITQSVDDMLKVYEQQDLENYISEMSFGTAEPAYTQKYDQDRVNLEAARRMLKNANNIMAESRYEQQGGLKGTEAAGLARGFGQHFADPTTWDFGARESFDKKAIYDALSAYEEGQELTPSQQMLLDAKVVELVVNDYFGGDVSRGYKAGQVTAESLPFMVEFIANPIAGAGKGAAKTMAKYALKRFAKKETKKLLTKGLTREVAEKTALKTAENAFKKGGSRYVAGTIEKGAARMLGDVVAAPSMTLTTGQLRTKADMYERMTPQLSATINEEGKPVVTNIEHGKDKATALREAFLNTTIENFSEMAGDYLAFARVGSGKMLGKIATSKAGSSIGLKAVHDFFNDINATEWAKAIGDFERKAEWHGGIGEFNEELLGGILNALLVGDQTLDRDPETGLFNRDNLIDTGLGVGVMSVVFPLIKSGGYFKKEARQMRKTMAQADDAASAAWGEDKRAWNDIRNTLAYGTEDEVKGQLKAIFDNPDATEKQKRAAWDFAIKAQAYQGMNNFEDRIANDPDTDPSLKTAIESFENGYEEVVEPEDRQYVYTWFKQKGDELRAMVGDETMQRIDENPFVVKAEIDQDATVSDDVKLAVAEYVAGKAYIDGVEQRIIDDADNFAAQQREALKSIQHPDGNIRKATMTVEGEEQPVEVYVTDGNIVMTPDGSTVEKEQSDKTVVVYNPLTGEKKQVDPSTLTYDQVQSVDDALADIETQRQTNIQRQLDEAQGKVTVGMTLPMMDGTDASVVSVNDDGTVTLQRVDGTQENMAYDDAQRLMDAKILVEYNERHSEDEQQQEQQPTTRQQQQTQPEQPKTPKMETVKGKPKDYKAGMTLTIKDEDGTTRDVVVTGKRAKWTPDGPVVDPDGRLVELYDPQNVDDSGNPTPIYKHNLELDEMVQRYSVPSAATEETQQEVPTEQAPATETEQPTETTENAPVTEQETPTEAAPEEPQQPTEETTDPMQQPMPMKKVGKKTMVDYRAATEERTYKYLYEDSVDEDFGADDADRIVKDKIAKAEKALSETKKLTGDVEEIKAKRKAARMDVDYWKKVQAIRERQRIEEHKQKMAANAAEDAARAEQRRKRAEEAEQARLAEQKRYQAEQERLKAEREKAQSVGLSMIEESGQQVVDDGGWKIEDDTDAMAIMNDTEPKTLEEVAANMLASGKYRLIPEETRKHTGHSKADNENLHFIFAGKDKGGLTPEHFGELVLTKASEQNVKFDETDANAGLNALLNVLGGVESNNDINNYIRNNRKAEAEQLHNINVVSAMQAQEEDRWIKQHGGMTRGEYANCIAYMEDAVEQGKTAITDEEFNNLFATAYDTRTTTNDEGSESRSAEKSGTNEPETRQAATAADDTRGDGEEAKPAAEQPAGEVDRLVDELVAADVKERAAAGKPEYNEAYNEKAALADRVLQVAPSLSQEDLLKIQKVATERGMHAVAAHVENELLRRKNEGGKKTAEDVETGGAVVDQLERMGVEVSTDISEMRRVRKQAEQDKSENGKLRELRTSTGKVYGFTYRGKLYIDPRKIDAELPLHEYGHLWTEAFRRLNPEGWNDLVETMKQDVEGWNIVKKLYPDLKTDSEIADEVIATFSGKNGGEQHTVWVPFSGEQVKRTDPVTYDDNGNVIPLSKRFNSRNADIRFQKATSIEEVKDEVLREFKLSQNEENGDGRRIFIGKITDDGRSYLEKMFGVKIKPQTSFILNSSDLRHIYNDHYGNNEKDKGNNIPLTDDDIRNIVDVITSPDKIVFGIDKKEGRKMFFFFKNNNNGTYNLTEVYANSRGNLTTKSYLKTKRTISQRIDDLFKSPTLTSVTGGASSFQDAKIPTLFETAKNNSQNAESQNTKDNEMLSRGVTDEERIAELESQPKVKMYRSMVLIDGKLYPPMSSKEADGKGLREPSEIGKWEESEEAPEKAVLRNGKWVFPLKKDNGKSLYAAYNPYIHTSATMLNDQFSEAQNRDNLVVVEMEVPVSELTSGYRAEKAKDTVGRKQWKAGVIQGQLSGTREVMLSRWAKPVRIVPTEEVAENIANQIDGIITVMPSNVVTPQVREAMEKLGVQFVETDNRGKIKEGENKGRTWTSVYGKGKSVQKLMREGEIEAVELEHPSENADWQSQVWYTMPERWFDIQRGTMAYEDGVRMSKLRGYSKKRYDDMLKKAVDGFKKHIMDLAEKMHIADRVQVVETADEITDARLTEKQKRDKALYDPTTGKIYIILGNNRDIDDAVKSLLHEAVGHHGLRELFGEHFDTFLDNVFAGSTESIRREIASLASKHGWNIRTATEEYLSMMAETMDFERPDRASWWGRVKMWFYDMLHKIGFKVNEWTNTITDNELSYLLWRSYQNLVNPGRYRSPIENAKDVVMQDKMKVGRYEEGPKDNTSNREALRAAEGVAEGIIDNVKLDNDAYVGMWTRMAGQDMSIEQAQAIKKAIEKKILNGLTQEELADHYDMLDAVNEYIAEKKNDEDNNGILSRDGDFTDRDVAIAKDAYEKIVAKSGYQIQEALQDSMLGLRKLYEAVLGEKNLHIEDVKDYENAYVAENLMGSVNRAEQDNYFSQYMRPLLSAIGEICGNDKEERQKLADYMMAKHGLERNEKFAQRDFNAYQQKHPFGQKKLDDFRSRDYAGLTALTGKDNVVDAEAEAQKMVNDFESQHKVTNLWKQVNNATKTTLAKVYLSGMMSKDSYNQVRDMFDYYIPLRGWDETTSDEVYGYLTSKDGPIRGGSIMKHAEGRSSKADDPIATIAMMADDAIRQGNRNVMKQRFLAFVMNHPSDLVSVNKLWLRYDDVNDEWVPVFADIKDGDTAADVERKVKAFEQRMEQLAQQDPDNYKRGRQAANIPYKVVNNNLNEHQILVRQNGETYVLTVNGNPRAAQALNGLTNPDVEAKNAIVNAVLNGVQNFNKFMSSAYTTKNPDFVLSNWLRDTVYTTTMVWVKESPKYAARFDKNLAKVNPATMLVLFEKWHAGKLDNNKELEKQFKLFMLNGGETGYTAIKDIEHYKKDIKKELRRNRNKAVAGLNIAGIQLDLLNRAVENSARFAAFLTSKEMGRSDMRSAYDAKEISVNFNKKGSGDKFSRAEGQTLLGKAASYVSGGGRLLYVFWNASLQGMTNVARATKRHPVKALTLAATMFALGRLAPILAQLMGGDDDDDKNAYYNLPEYVRRSNFCVRAGDVWITIPLPIEYRVVYGMGELYTGITSGNEHYTDKEMRKQIVSQLSQAMPIDFMEGGGGLHAFVPSVAKPFVEASNNKSWTGLPLYRDTPYNQDDPDYTKVYSNADKYIVGASKWLNEMSGGDEYKKGLIDINPAKVEYILKGYLGGWFNLPNQLVKMGETATGNRDFEWRNMMLANRVVKEGDERTERRKLTNEYFNYLDEYKETDRLIKNYTKAAESGTESDKYSKKLQDLYNSDEYSSYLVMERYKPIFDAYHDLEKDASDEERKVIADEVNELRKECIGIIRSVKNDKNYYYEPQTEETMQRLYEDGRQEIRDKIGSMYAKQQGTKDSYGGGNADRTDYGVIYERNRDYLDMAGDIALQVAIKDAKEDGDEERRKALEKVRKDITELKKQLPEYESDPEYIMNEIRSVRNQAFEDYGITTKKKEE